MSNCITDIKTIHRFLNLTGGNWRNSIYIECRSCSYPHEDGCEGYLCVFDEEAKPVLLPICDCKVLFCRTIDPSECLLWITQFRFLEIYKAQYRRVPNDSCCPLLTTTGINR